MKTNFLTILCLFFLSNLFAQQIKDELIVRLAPETNAADFEQSLSYDRSLSESILEFTSIGPSWDLYKMVVKEAAADQILAALNRNDAVISTGYNFQLKTKDNTPNDVQFGEQWDMEVINAPEVWEFTTGGVTALGDTIVIANLEYTDLDHEDLVDNIWINHNEIPNNFDDDDDNGYIDDYRGYNVLTFNDFVDTEFLEVNSHGTQVSGIMAASGNNTLGISGVNWNVKLMVVSSKLVFSDIVGSYQYILDMRTLYNDTNGAKGAFIVCTNASFGIKAFPQDEPIFEDWCDIFDSLGEVGVLSVGATTNDNVDIDIMGDMPTSCPSEYLVTVTNVTQANLQRGGFSNVNIDLGAPGSEALSTEPFDVYGDIGGTSSAAPHVTGGIGLLYSAPCLSFAEDMKANPAAAALTMKDFILSGTSPLGSLEDITVTGGLLNLKKSFDLMQNYCGSSTGPLEILTVRTNIDRQEISVEYQTPENGPYTVRVYDALGRLILDGVDELELFDSKKFNIDLSPFASGVYFLSIENVDNIVSKPFVVYYNEK
ncbi:MAG: hypothetical protein ACI8YQ_002238 [Polaribacter sp.]|jgi:hypothetical protein